MEWHSVRRSGERFVLRHRRTIIVGLVAVAALNTAAGFARGPGAQRSVVVASSAIDAGAAIRTSKLRTESWPAAIVPSDWPSEPAQLDGRISAGTIAIGEPITPSRLLAARKSSLAQGLVLAPIRIADAATVALVNSGDVIDVIASWPASQTGPASATTIASHVRVATVPRTPTSSFSNSVDGALLVLEVPAATAVRIAAAAVSGRLSITLTSSYIQYAAPTN